MTEPGPERVEEARLVSGPDGALGVVKAVAAIVGAMPGIAKAMQERQGQGDDRGVKYPFRGIDAIAAEARPLFAEHGVLIVPGVEVLDRGDAPGWKESWTDVLVRVRWMLVHVDGSQLRATTYGLGRDNADKGTNKAQTQAFKYLLMHLLMISDPKDDADEVDISHGRRGDGVAPAGPASVQDRARLGERIAALPQGLREDLQAAWQAEGSSLRGWSLKDGARSVLPATHVADAWALVEAHEARARQAGVSVPPAAPQAVQEAPVEPAAADGGDDSSTAAQEAAAVAAFEAQAYADDAPDEPVPDWMPTTIAIAGVAAEAMDAWAAAGGNRPGMETYVQKLHQTYVNRTLADLVPGDDIPWPPGQPREWAGAPIGLRRMAVTCAFLEARLDGRRHPEDVMPG